METVLGNLEAAEYWQWAKYIEEMQHAELKEKFQRMYFSCLEKDIEISKLRTAIFKRTIDDAASNAKDKKQQYESFKKELENRLGFSLSSTVIDETTFEIKILE